MQSFSWQSSGPSPTASTHPDGSPEACEPLTRRSSSTKKTLTYKVLPRCEPPFSAVPPHFPAPASPCSRPAALRRLPNRDCSCASQVLRRPTPAQSPPTLRFGRPENARSNSGLPTALYPEAPLGGGVMPSATQWASVPSWVPQIATGTLLIRVCVTMQAGSWLARRAENVPIRPAGSDPSCFNPFQNSR